MSSPPAHAAPTIRITTFGTLQVARDGQAVDESAWRTRQARQLLKVLITERPRPVATDRLIDLLWPGNSVESAATTLRSAINALRNVLEPDRPNRAPSRYIHTQSPGYAYRSHPHIWLDVEVFENLLRHAEKTANADEKQRLLEEATALYKDDYLISDPYADWAKSERERLRELYFHGLLTLADLYSKAGNYTDAIPLARLILSKDEVRENAYQSLMRYQAESGDSAAALITYERCRAILGEELGADPSPVTQELHSRILNGEIDVRDAEALASHSPDPPPAHAYRPRSGFDGLNPSSAGLPQQILLPTLDDALLDAFVGRSAEIAAIGGALTQALAGNGSIALLAGEAGVGKSRLAYEILRRAESAGTTVISAACQQLERNLPYAPLADGISRYLQLLPDSSLRRLPPAALTQLVQILPTLQDRLGTEKPESSQDSLPDESRQRIIDGIVTFLTRLAELRPLILFLDDLHWADADSLAVLSRLSQQITNFPILLLLAYREEDLTENESLRVLLRALRRAPFSRIFAVERLTPDESRSLVAQLLGSAQQEIEPLAAALYRTSAGNALFLTEAVKNLRERSEQPGEPSPHFSPSQRVQEIIEERIDRLPADSLAVLRLAAVVGRDFSVELLEEAAESDPAPGLDVLLRRQFLLERPDERMDFVHQIVRQVAYDQLNSLQRRRLHARVARALVSGGKAHENPAETAFHFGQAGSSARPDFAHYSLLAGEALLRTFAPQQAIAHFDGGLAALGELSNPTEGLIEQGFRGLGLAYESLLDPDGVTRTYSFLRHWALEKGDKALALMAHTRLTTLLGLVGQQAESNALMEELIVGPNERPSPALADMLARRAVIFGRDEEEVEAGDEWAVLVPPPPVVADPVADLTAAMGPVYAALPLLIYGWILQIQGQLDDSTVCLRAGVEMAQASGQRSLASLAYHQLAVTALLQGDIGESQRLNDESKAINQAAHGPGAQLASLWPRISSGYQALAVGNLAQAESRFQQIGDFLANRDSFRTHLHSTVIGLGLVALERGEVERAQTLLSQATADPENRYPYTYVLGRLGLARIAHRQGDDAAARSILRRTLSYAATRSLVREYAECREVMKELAVNSNQ